MTLWLDSQVEGLRLDSWVAELAVDCPECVGGVVRWRGEVHVVRGDYTGRLLGVPCDRCDRRFSVEFDIIPPSEVEH